VSLALWRRFARASAPLSVALLLALAPVAVGAEPNEAAGLELFESRIRPLLHRACLECHNKGPESEGGLQLNNRENMLRGGQTGPAVVPGQPDQSLLLAAVRHEGDLQMPPETKLSHEEIDALSRWVSLGAPWPSDAEIAADLSGDKGDLWSLKPIQDPPAPDVKNTAWPQSPIDRFVLARLEQEQLEPAAPADKRTLLRRLTFDLVGLPPTPEEIAAFLADESPTALTTVVDRLLASPHYGERWARHWMDLMRYAETNGYERNREKVNAWRYRDYLIEAFNSDLPFNRLVQEHLAGDLLSDPRASADGKLVLSPQATASLWFQEIHNYTTDWPTTQADELEDQIDVLGKALLGLSTGCARCHDHKFDPIQAADYYSLAGVILSSTNVQSCVDTPQVQSRQAELSAALGETQAAIDALLEKARRGRDEFERRLTEARRVRDYLMATRELILATFDKKKPIPEVAAAYGLDTARLERWIEAFAQAAAQPDALLGSWTRVGLCADDVFGYRKDALLHRAQRPANPPKITPLFDFENSDGFDGWTVAGAAFASGPELGQPYGAQGYAGKGFASSHAGSDAFTGTMLSPRIKVDRPNLSLAFLLAGGNHPERACVNLIIHSQVLHQDDGSTYTGENDHVFRPQVFSLMPFKGREVCVELVDDAQDEWGQIMADHFCLIDPGPDSGAAPDALTVNDAVLRVLTDPACRRSVDLATGYQTAIVNALTDWRSELDRYLAAPEGQPEPAALRWTRAGFEYSERSELLAWALSDNSLLGSLADAEASLPEADRAELARLRERHQKLSAEVEASALAITSAEAVPRDAAIHLRGDAHRPGAVAPRGYLLAVSGPGPAVASGSGRRELAAWMSAADNPLTPRVIVNRVWQRHFGRGIVATPDDFGHRGEPPTHPELLDYLATRFIESGWSLKSLHRELLLSSAYQQCSAASAAARERDPDNRWLSHMPIRRMEAECVRDAILAASGALRLDVGGPSISLAPKIENDARRTYVAPTHTAAEQTPRRTIYLEVRRNFVPKMLEVFDFPEPAGCIGQRAVSITPLQSLNLLNDSLVAAEAQRWGASLHATSLSPAERVDQVYERALGRLPMEEERDTALAFVADQTARQAAAGSTAAERDAWVDFCHLVFNLGEFIFVR
jgi:hypothetical protein